MSSQANIKYSHTLDLVVCSHFYFAFYLIKACFAIISSLNTLLLTAFIYTPLRNPNICTYGPCVLALAPSLDLTYAAGSLCSQTSKHARLGQVICRSFVTVRYGQECSVNFKSVYPLSARFNYPHQPNQRRMVTGHSGQVRHNVLNRLIGHIGATKPCTDKFVSANVAGGDPYD